MKRKYKIFSIVYSSILIFSVLFLLLLLGASGHRVKFDGWDYSIPIFVIFNIILLYIFPKISDGRGKLILQFVLVSFLLTSSFFVLRTVFEILKGNSIPSAVLFLLSITGIFIYSVSIIILEIFKRS